MLRTSEIKTRQFSGWRVDPPKAVPVLPRWDAPGADPLRHFGLTLYRDSAIACSLPLPTMTGICATAFASVATFARWVSLKESRP